MHLNWVFFTAVYDALACLRSALCVVMDVCVIHANKLNTFEFLNSWHTCQHSDLKNTEDSKTKAGGFLQKKIISETLFPAIWWLFK